MILKYIVCMFKGHDIDVNESIVSHVMVDKRNYLCKCHRCGLYEMYDGAMSHIRITLTEKSANEIKREFEELKKEFDELI